MSYVSILNTDNINHDFIYNIFNDTKKKDIKHSKFTKVALNTICGYHSFNEDPKYNNELPDFKYIEIQNIILLFTGKIYNYYELYSLMQNNILNNDIKNINITNFDYEVIIHLYKEYGFEHTLNLLDGEFSFILIDNTIYNECSKLYVARDPIGVKPLYQLICNNTFNENKYYFFSTDLKILTEYKKELNINNKISHFIPGTYSEFIYPFKVLSKWEVVYINKKYHNYGFNNIINLPIEIFDNIHKYIIASIEKRCSGLNQPIACLLSGGVDSSIIAAITNDLLKILKKTPLETYSIGLENSTDLIYAKKVANYIGSNHTEIIITQEQLFNAIPEVINAVETYDVETVRSSIGNYLLAKYIYNNSKAKIVLNGDGLNDVAGGYLDLYNCNNVIQYDKDIKKLLQDTHKFNILRSQKCMSYFGLESCSPFLDRSFVNYYQLIHPIIRFQSTINECEKYLIRYTFSPEKYYNSYGKQLLPNEILWRKRESFSDGMTNIYNPIYKILHRFIEPLIKSTNSSLTKEQEYYLNIFNSYYYDKNNILDYYWLPKYCNINDPSAMLLDNYLVNKYNY